MADCLNNQVNNILDNLPEFPQEEEIFNVLTQKDIIKIERIVSSGQSSPENFWYEQKENEFVLLLSGSAELEFADSIRKLNKFDYVIIPAGVRHRVKSTSKSEHTIWLAVFFA